MPQTINEEFTDEGDMAARQNDVGDLPTSYVSYDLETTGLGANAHIIEVGAIRVFDGYEDERFSTFVSLPTGARIGAGAFEVNHITPAMLEGAPSMDEAFRAFSAFVGELPLVGQNVIAFDNRFIDREAARMGLRSPTENGSFDTMILYGELVGRPRSLAAICEHYGVDNEEAHRAWSDARATSDCYLALLRDARSRPVAPALGIEGHELDGRLVCFCGNTHDFPRRACAAIAVGHGATPCERVTRKVGLVIDLSGRETSRLRLARRYEIEVVDGEGFLAMVGLTAEDLRRPSVTPRP